MNEEQRDYLHQAIADIKEWLVDNAAEAIVENLNEEASDAALASAEKALGVPLPEALWELYALHDGQPNEGDCLFEHMNFLSLERMLASREGMLYAYFGVRPEGIDQAAIFCADGSQLLESELTSRWAPFANTEGDFLALNLDSGRVFRVVKDVPAIRLEADDLPSFLGRYASRLWEDFYALTGDTNLAGVTEEGLVALKRYPFASQR